jgi:hypothetical protein
VTSAPPRARCASSRSPRRPSATLPVFGALLAAAGVLGLLAVRRRRPAASPQRSTPPPPRSRRCTAYPFDLVRTGDAHLDDRAEALVLAAREAMANAARHSGTDEISVFVDVGADDLAVFVRDRGRGFDPDAAAAPGHGIEESIRGRMARAGGTAAIESSPEGTEVELRLRRRP